MQRTIGGFSLIGRGTPEGDGKDRAMREVAQACIVELKEGYRPSSSATTLARLGMWDIDQGEHGIVIMLARNGGLSGQPLKEETKYRIQMALTAGCQFVVGDMPGVDDRFHWFLDSIGAEYTIFHSGDYPRTEDRIHMEEFPF